MYNRRFKHDVNELLKEGQELAKYTTRAGKFHTRIIAVNSVLSGIPSKDVAENFGVSARSVERWVKMADEIGWESLLSGTIPGRPSRFSEEQTRRISELIDEDNPGKYGYRVWDGKALSDFIGKEFGITYSVRSSQWLLRKLKFSLIVPQPFPSLDEENTEEKKNFKKKLRIVIWDGMTKHIVVFQDEVHFTVQTTVTRRWARQGSKPRVKSKPGREKVSYSGFVIPENGQLIITTPPHFNFETVIESIRKFIAKAPEVPEGYKYLIVMDNASWHKKAARLIWEEENPEYADIRKVADCMFLPPYSPDLNPIEQVWRKTRREATHNTYFPNKEALSEKLNEYFTQFAKPNEELQSLCSFKTYWGEEEEQRETA